jgi:two-component system, OmpR family, sensor kinase
MRILPASIAGRFLTLLFASLLVLHLGSIGLYHLGLESELDVTNEQRLAERLASVKRAIAHETPAGREELAHALSGGPLEVHWSETASASPPDTTGVDFSSLKQKVLAAVPEIEAGDLTVRSAIALPEHASATRFLLVSMRLEDGSSVDVTATRNLEPRAGLNQIALSTTIMVLGVIAVAAVLIRQLTRSLRLLADAADRLDLNASPSPVDETGPIEVKALAVAFNEMQQRVKRLLDERTQTLAAISHDLKTPLTRMRLRSEDIADPDLARSVEADLAEMEAMIDGTLDFLRGEVLSEAIKPLDLVPLLSTICSDLSDTGHDVDLQAARPYVIRGRRLALKRALTNLIDNAVKYGNRARVTLSGMQGSAEIRIEDQGPGIPEEEIGAVLRPFYRLETSRNKETGGVGLGLSVAHAIISSHGGALRLENGPEKGLIISVTLPR